MICCFLPAFVAVFYFKDKNAAIQEADLALSSELNSLLEQRVARPKRRSNYKVELANPNNWYATWGVRGNYFDKSDNAPEIELPTNLEVSPKFVWVDDYRVLYHYGPGKRTIYAVGTPAGPIHARLNTILLGGIAGGITLSCFAIFGGYRTSKNALKPIEDFSKSAVEISKGKFDERIDPSEVKTELKELAQVLNQAFQHIDDTLETQRNFTSDASHELRTPISILILELESALRNPRTQEQYIERITTCLDATKRLKNLANSLLELSQIESGTTKLELRSCSISDIINSSTLQMQPAADEGNLTLSSSSDDTRLNLDSLQISRVIINLLSNAVHHTPKGGSISISTQSTGNTLEIQVVDTGGGIPADELPHIFDRFYRADKARTSSQNRSGLGLAICQSIIHAHKGSIHIDSIEGEGTTVTIRLPK